LNIGGARGSAGTANNTIILTARTDMAGRDQVGNYHIGPLAADDQDEGAPVPGLVDAVTAFGDRLLEMTAFAFPGGGYCDWCLFNWETHQASNITNIMVGDRIGTMRRRTLRVGE